MLDISYVEAKGSNAVYNIDRTAYEITYIGTRNKSKSATI